MYTTMECTLMGFLLFVVILMKHNSDALHSNIISPFTVILDAESLWYAFCSNGFMVMS